MSLPEPYPGLVIRYAYLWRREFLDGREEASKDRPCAIVLAAPLEGQDRRVFVLPITHTAPVDPTTAMALPPAVKAHLGLDAERSWIVLDEFNDFVWPGYDLRPVPGREPARIDYGPLPPRLFARVRDAFITLAKSRRSRRLSRD